MFGSLFKKMDIRRASNHPAKTVPGQAGSPVCLTKNLEKNLYILREVLGQSNDVIIRSVKIGSDRNVDAAVVFIDGLIDRNLVNHDILRPLMFNLQLINNKVEGNISNIIEFIQSSVVTVGQITTVTDVNQVVAATLSGHTVLLVEGVTEALDIDARGWSQRSIEEPKNEISIRGPKDSLNETLRTNTALIRRKIRDPRLTFENLKIGKRSKTDVSIAYINGLTKESLVAELKQRLDAIDIDAILDAGYIEQFIEDSPASLFPTVGNTERPDVVTARILEGRVAILVDGSPTALTVPLLFMEGFQNPDDYYARPYFATLVRCIRFLGFVLSIYLPGLYVALMSFHQELFPTPLLISVAAAKEGIPFPVVLEALLMLVLFEILREAGLRMPRSLGQAVSIVGALVIGQAAVSAGLVGAPMVIVVATTAIASFLVVSYADLAAILRLIFTLIAGFLGLFGIIIVSLEVLSYLVALRSFGVPYLSPLTPFSLRSLKDSFIRVPLWMMDQRPEDFDPLDSRRQSSGQKPSASETKLGRRKTP